MNSRVVNFHVPTPFTFSAAVKFLKAIFPMKQTTFGLQVRIIFSARLIPALLLAVFQLSHIYHKTDENSENSTRIWVETFYRKFS